MTIATNHHATFLPAFLSKHASEVRQATGADWDFALTNGKAWPGRASLDEEWLSMSVPLDETANTEAMFELLVWNGQLAGASKFVLAPPDNGFELRADIPLVEETDLGSRVGDTCRSLQAALSRVHVPDSEGEVRERATGSAIEAEPANELAEVVKEAGWDCGERAGGKLTVDLGADAGFRRAIIEPADPGWVQLAVELLAPTRFPELNRQALTVLLLTVCGAVRLVRAAVEEEGEEVAAWLEVQLPAPPSPAGLGHGTLRPCRSELYVWAGGRAVHQR